MLIPNPGRRSAIFILILAVSVLAFAAWLKISPSLTGSGAEATQMTKLWVDPTQGWDTLVKLAPVGIILALFAYVPSLGLARDWSWQCDTAPKPAARDIFMESRHWFRPPPPLF